MSAPRHTMWGVRFVQMAAAVVALILIIIGWVVFA